MEGNGLASMINLMMLSAIKNKRAMAAVPDDGEKLRAPL